MKSLLIIYSLLLLIKCDSKIKNYEEYFDLDKKKPRVIGLIDVNSKLETGNWTYYDSLSNVTEQGNIVNGFMTGDWLYKDDSNNPFTINWAKFADSSKNITCNYPSNFKKLDNKDCLFVATNNDTTNRVNIIINKIQLESDETTESHRIAIINTVKESYNVVSYKCQYQSTMLGETYCFLEFNIDKGNRLFNMFHIFKNNKENQITEVNCFTIASKKYLGYKLFAGTFFHTNIDNKRFFNPLDKIEQITICD